MKKNPPEFIFLKDEPQTKSEVSYERFYHNSIAPALKKILKDDTSPHTIGLFGAWGAGKSTVIEMVKNDSDLNLPVFIFDAWKYKDDTLRRTFLIKLVDFLNANKIKIDEDILTPLYSSITNSVAKSGSSNTNEKKPWYRKLAEYAKRYILVISLVVSVVFIVLFNTIWKDVSVADLFKTVLSFVASISILIVILKPAIEEIVKIAVNSLFSKQIFQTDLITKTIQQDRLNSPEQFEEKFINILEHVDKKMVIVFDNIDRVQGDVAISMLTTIKTFMYSNAKNGLVFIVPCDPTAIEVQVEKYFYGTNGARHDSFGAAEYLRKIFNLIIWIPDFINTDLEQYTKDLIRKTGRISKLLDDEDVILVINSAFSRNPREIIQFINNLIAMVISTRGTGVKNIIDSNIAYLAKVLIIRQKFPKAYESLKENWHHPEAILNGMGDDSLEFTRFMQKTSRITVDDAEPFIYFKDPADSRGLKNANDIKNALVAGNVTEAIEASKAEPVNILIEFITDLVIKYSGQENILNNVVVTQFEILSDLGIEIDSKRYINEIAKTIDTELWPKYENLPLTHVFKLLTNKKISLALRTNLVTRYLGVIGSVASIASLRLGVIASLKENSKILSKQHKTEFRTVLESSYNTNEEALAIFDDLESQEAFITEKLMSNYIASFDFNNLTTKLATIEIFKDYVLRHSLVPDVVSAISELFKNDITITSSYSENKSKIVEAISPLTKIFGAELKKGSKYLNELTQNIIKVMPYTPNWEQRADQTIGLFWIRNYLNDADQPAAIDAITSYFQSYSELNQLQRPLDYWSEESSSRFIKLVLPTILPRLTTSHEILQYIYSHAAAEEKKTIINDLIARVQPDNYYDIDFLSTLQKLPDRKETISKLLDKAHQNTYTYKTKYFDFIAAKMLKSDTVELKLALEQIKTLVTSNDAAQAEIGYSFFKHLQFIQETDRRRLATELLVWLREPGRSISHVHRVAFQTINDNYSLLQDTPKNDYIYLLFNLITETQDIQMIQIIVNALQVAQPNYKMHARDFDDLLSRMHSWSNTQAKQEIFKIIPTFVNSRQSQAEKKYWESFSALYPPEEI
jgi:hypothetical protein